MCASREKSLFKFILIHKYTHTHTHSVQFTEFQFIQLIWLERSMFRAL